MIDGDEVISRCSSRSWTDFTKSSCLQGFNVINVQQRGWTAKPMIQPIFKKKYIPHLIKRLMAITTLTTQVN